MATSSLFNKEVFCVFLTCCTMEKQIKFNFMQTVIICTLVSRYSVPIAAIIEISHSLKKYLVIKKYTGIHIYSWIFCSLIEREVTHWLVSLVMLSLGGALHRTKLVCSRIYRNMPTQAKPNHKLQEKILGQLKLIWGIKHIFLLSISYYGTEMLTLLADVSPLKTSTDKFYKMRYVFMKAESELNNSMINIVMRNIMAYFYP